MTEQLTALDSETHRTLRIEKPAHERRHFVAIAPSEFAVAAASCPVLFAKRADTGAFYAAALMGFREGENLLAAAYGDASRFVPQDAICQGLFIDGDHIAIDADHARFSHHSGDPLFEADGTPAPALHRIRRALTALAEGADETQKLVAALNAHRLIEPLDVSLQFDDGERIVLDGLYTVSLDALHDLDDAAVVALFRAGHLQLAHIMAASLRQLPLLAQARNRQLTMA
ncbi:SapC family protein [Stakelama pacifica]|uniref:SapC protein n=1 Tax=Stakelama pacifica TaxID=517720 RepID=A0A4R6FMQ7_9SPHN|nr:SapC family protein [Stakelama pacifica]TDN82280.1 SapC protein [Stakelama pacifica]